MNLIPVVKKLSVFLCLFYVVAFSVFAQKVIKTDTSHYVTLHIDPSNAMGGNVSDVFSEVNYIPLETTAESTFGSIAQLEVVDNYYIILDENTACILIFNKDGKFHAKIKCKVDPRYKGFGGGPTKIHINRWTKQIVYSDDHYKTKIYCDLDGKFIKAEDSIIDGLNPTEFYFVSPSKFINADRYRNYDETESGYKPFLRSQIQFIDGKNIYATGFNYSRAQGKKETVIKGIAPLSYSGNDTVLFYSESYKNRVNTVTPTTIKRTYQFVFPLLMTLPPDFNTNAIYDTTSYEYINKHKDVIFSINNFYKSGNNLLFEAWSHDFDSRDHSLIYNLRSGMLVSFEHLTPDELSFFLPIYGGNFLNKGIHAFDGKYAYTSIPSVTMFKANDDNKDKNVKYNPALTNYFGKGTKKDNPVIVQFKLKDNL